LFFAHVEAIVYKEVLIKVVFILLEKWQALMC